MTTIPENVPADRDAPPLPFQFGLKALFIAMACLGVLFAVMKLLGPGWSTMLLWFLGLAIAHVVANAWGGTHGWGHVGQQPFEPLGDDLSPLRPQASGQGIVARTIRPLAPTPATRLRETSRLSWKMLAATCSGAAIAGGLAAGCLATAGSAKIGYAAIAVGGFSAAVVGGFFGFLASSFVEVGGQAWREAAQGRPAIPRFETGEDALG